MASPDPKDFQCLAVDLGAESGRVASLSRRKGRLALEVLHSFRHEIQKSEASLHWDLEGIWQGIQTGLALAGGAAKAPDSVGVDSWAVDYVLLGRDQAPLRPPYSYRDPRGQRGMQRLLPALGRKALYARNGIQIQPFNTLFQAHAHALEHPADLERAECLLLLPDYFHFLLSGRRACEWTNASTTQFALSGGKWDAELLGEAGLDPGLLPPIVPPGTVLGPLLKPLARRFKLQGARVVAGATHDTASAVHAAPCLSPEGAWAFLSCGTWSLLGLELQQPLLSPEAAQANFTNEGGTDGRTRFLKNIPGLWVTQRLRRERFKDCGYDELTRIAESAAPLEFIFDAGDPSLLNPDSMFEAVERLCRVGGGEAPQRGAQVLRAALESLALEYRHALAQAERLSGHRVECIQLLGGGSKNALLCQMTADACGLPVHTGPEEASLIGNALMQARGLRKIASLSEARGLAAQFSGRSFWPKNPGPWNAAYQRTLALKEQPIHA
jgi:rhamnulokinase